MSIRTATTFWIAAGALSGEARNQNELPNELVEFFTDAERQAEVITIEVPGVGPIARPLTYRGTDYGQWTEIWRLGLPTQNMGAPSYVDHVIQLDRVQRGNQNAYLITRVVDGSPAHQQLRSQSIAPNGAAGVTAGPNGREWGYF
jgi:hypothetical protein